ncbi:MAG: hypothetical protein LW823_07505 [Rickettsiales bacterium]|nr:hypothetical protein [Rickettsiales bacterium]
MRHPVKIYGLAAASLATVGAIQTLAFAAEPLKLSSKPAADPLSLAQSVGLSPQWDFGPVSVGGRYDSTLGAIAEARYSRLIDNNWAVGLIGEAGAKNNRINATLGHQFSESAQVKVTGEYLSQELPFYFDSGRIDERVGQQS